MRTTLPNGLNIDILDHAETAFLYREIFVERQYAPPELHLPPRPTIVDVGANIGVFSLFALHEWAPALLVAVEPFTHVARSLRNNLRQFSAANVVQAAIGDSSGRVEFEYYPSCSVMSGRSIDPERDRAAIVESRLQSAAESGPEVRRRLRAALERIAAQRCRDVATEWIQQTTLSKIVADRCPGGVDLLKIDVEGDEMVALESLGDQADLVANLLIEVDETRVSPATVERWLGANDFVFLKLPRGRAELATMTMIFAHRPTAILPTSPQ
ncbi:hypothetical protein BH10ACT8_BH10ACT8_08470 [soil metagenome]